MLAASGNLHEEVVKLLLTVPGIDVNAQNEVSCRYVFNLSMILILYINFIIIFDFIVWTLFIDHGGI